ncbi:hypothetical protein WN944_027170 [Citrus x changshan-huyou]|uniref:CCHC-type domain-containing protein n=1 Tax=Citrus x changshan-huyou TaxID=2935761 RepID=A0AAP0LLE6_9ROSI
MENAKAAPTGCFKCGRPGHWSRDCPSSSSSAPSNSNFPSNNTASGGGGGGSGVGDGGVSVSKSAIGVKEKPKKLPRSRPKLTPDLLLSDDGLGFVLRHFPRAFKYRGRGHEVSDLGHLIGLYSEWHSHLLPYYSFDHFVSKVEQVAASRRVKMCIRDLRDRVANGGDPTKLHEAAVEHDGPVDEQAPAEAMSSERQPHQQDLSSNVHAADDFNDLFNKVYRTATEESSQALQGDVAATNVPSTERCEEGSPKQVPNNEGSRSSEVHVTEEQRARMEANRLKALERAAARARQLQVS